MNFLEHCCQAWKRNIPRLERSRKRMRVVETLSLADRRSVVMMECEGRRFLLGSTPTAINVIAYFEAAEEPK